MRRLAAHADVVIENFKVGGLAKYGLDADSLQALNPRLVYCSITGFGQTGPYAPRAGYDFMIQGMGGIMDLTGEPDGEPQKAGRRLRRHLHRHLLRRRQFSPRCGGATRRARAPISTWRLLDVADERAREPGDELSRLGPQPPRMGNAHPEHRPLSGLSRRRTGT